MPTVSHQRFALTVLPAAIIFPGSIDLRFIYLRSTAAVMFTHHMQKRGAWRID